MELSDVERIIQSSFPQIDDEDVLDYLASAIVDEPSMDVEEMTELFSSFLLSHEICEDEDTAGELCRTFHTELHSSLGNGVEEEDKSVKILKAPKSMTDNFNTDIDQSQVCNVSLSCLPMPH